MIHSGTAVQAFSVHAGHNADTQLCLMRSIARMLVCLRVTRYKMHHQEKT